MPVCGITQDGITHKAQLLDCRDLILLSGWRHTPEGGRIGFPLQQGMQTEVLTL